MIHGSSDWNSDGMLAAVEHKLIDLLNAEVETIEAHKELMFEHTIKAMALQADIDRIRAKRTERMQ